jgi:integrase
MARAGNLDTRTIEAAKPRAKSYRLSDGGGLLLEVTPTGAKKWAVRFMQAGKRRDMGLGGFPLVSLREARERAAEARKAARAGVDPLEQKAHRAREREAARAAKAEGEARTFRAVALRVIEAEAPGWKDAKTPIMWRGSLERWAFPTLGNMPVAAIDRAAVLEAVGEVWRTRPATARKVLRRIAAVLRYAAAHGWRGNDNPADAKMLRHAGLPALPGGKRQPSLPWPRMPAFWKALDRVEGLGACALRVAILTALRSVEVRHARWAWVSFDGPAPVLTVPGAMMKGKKSAEVQPHRVPLPPAALEALARAYGKANGTTATAGELPKLATLAGDARIFPSSTRRTPISDMALSAVLRRMNATASEGQPPPWRDADGREAVPHGFRATFSTWVDDTRPEEREAAEKALAHEVANKVSGAYRRSDLFDRRIRLMAAWAEHVTGETCADSRPWNNVDKI